MGHGDDIMASGMARGAHARGKRIAFGDGRRIIWGPHSAEIFAGNPNIAPPGCEQRPDIEWINYYKGNRIYNRIEGNRWVWNYEFRPTPGQIYFQQILPPPQDKLIIIEPNVPRQKSVAVNKQWPVERYQQVADKLLADGWQVVQPDYSGALHRLRGVQLERTRSFREALILLKQARLYIGPEGGSHHGAAAMNTPAVVLFGGFIPPLVTGYDFHVNLTGGAEACGNLGPCQHCVDAMARISVDCVLESAQRKLQ